MSRPEEIKNEIRKELPDICDRDFMAVVILWMFHEEKLNLRQVARRHEQGRKITHEEIELFLNDRNFECNVSNTTMITLYVGNREGREILDPNLNIIRKFVTAYYKQIHG